MSRLFQAVFKADEEGVRRCLAAGDDANERREHAETPLMVAAREGYVRIMEALLRAGTDAAARDLFGKTALVHAFFGTGGENAGGREAAVRLLLEHGCAFDLEFILHVALDWHRQGRPTALVNVPDFRTALARIAEANGIQIGRGWTSRTLEYRRFPTPQGDLSLKIDLHLPDPMPPKAPPLFVFIHGGSWIGGNKKDEPVWLVTKLGFAAASVEYRWTTQAAFPAPVKDCKAAIRFLRSHAWEYGYDPERMGVLGNSAGGHLALMLGLTPDDPELDADAGDPNVSSSVAAVCSMSGPADFEPYFRIFRLLGQAADEPDARKQRQAAQALLEEPFIRFSLRQLSGPAKAAANAGLSLLRFRPVCKLLRAYVHKLVAGFYFDNKAPLGQADVLTKISSLHHARLFPDLPPDRKAKVASFFIAHGAEDPLVPVSGARDLSRTMDEVGIPNEYRELPEAGHDASSLFPAAFRFLKERLG